MELQTVGSLLFLGGRLSERMSTAFEPQGQNVYTRFCVSEEK